MKKIGIYDPYLDDNGGGERYMITIATCLAKKYQVDIFWDKRKDLEVVGERFDLEIKNLNLTENIFSPIFSKKEKLTRTKKYDAIIVLSDGSIPILFSKKSYLHMQQPIEHKLSIKDKLKLKKIDKLIVNSTFTKNFIEEKYKKNCDLLYPPVSIIKPEHAKENIILHVGRFRVMNVKSEDYKKQHFMIDTFKEMVDDGFKDWKLLMAISVNDENDPSFIKMKKNAENYPIDFLVNAKKEKLWKEAGKAKIYWHATGYGEDLVKSPHLAEHFGISTAEAMGAGIVPVVISAGGQKEIVDDNLNGFLWNTKEELVNKTQKLSKDAKLLDKMSKEAQEKVKKFSDENFCKKVQELINV